MMVYFAACLFVISYIWIGTEYVFEIVRISHVEYESGVEL